MIARLLRPCLALLAASLICSPAAHAGARVPVKSSLEGRTLGREIIGDPAHLGVPFVRVVTEAEGTASHAGRVRILSEYLVHLTIEAGVLVAIGEGTYETTTANGTVWHGAFRLRQVVGQATFTFHAEEDSGAVLDATGESFPDGTFHYTTSGTTANPGHGH